VTGGFFFGKKFGSQKVAGLPIATFMQDSLTRFMEELFSLTTLIFGQRFMKTNILERHKKMNREAEELKTTFKNMIKEAESSGIKDKNLLTLLLDIHTNETGENCLTHDQIVGEFMGLFAAGTDTTSHLLGSAIYFLWKYPNVLAKVKEEVDREFVDLNKVDIETINRMDYTTAVLKETLRLGGPVTSLFDRTPVRDDDLCGVNIKKGDLVIIYLRLYYSSDKYFPQAREFIPERWLSNASHRQDGFKSEPYSFIPFSAGPRNCIGQHLAMIEASILLALFIKTFTFSFPEDYKFVLVQRFTFETFDPLLVTLTPKNEKEATSRLV